MRFNVFAKTLTGAFTLCLPFSVLPTLSPNPSLAQRAREGGQVNIWFCRFGQASTGVAPVGLPTTRRNGAVAATASGVWGLWP